VSQFNDGVYDIIIAADESSLDNPATVKTESSSNKRKKLVLSFHIVSLAAMLIKFLRRLEINF